MKMLYDKGYPDNSPHYLLLFGIGTYDPKNRVTNNDNYIPPYESNEYLSLTMSYVSDDYFGIMADTDGNAMNGTIDIGIGRLPVNSIEQAQDVFNKILRYSSFNDSTMADWKNTFTFVADNPDSKLTCSRQISWQIPLKTNIPFLMSKRFTMTLTGLPSLLQAYVLPIVRKQ